MKTFGIKTDYVFVTMKNDGFAWIVTEKGGFEATKEVGYSYIREARKQGYKEVYYKHHSNGDHEYKFN